MAPETGHRLQWDDIPPHVRTELEGQLGAAVVEAIGQAGGYSPSLAARCRLADGRRVFVKAVSSDQNPQSPRMLRAEIETAAVLPDAVPAPRLLHALDDGRWVAAVFEDVDGRLPQQPWARSELDAVLAAVDQLGSIPFDASAHAASVPPVAIRFGPLFGNWRILAGEPGQVPDGVWWSPLVERLATMEERWAEAVAGPDLLHGDIRSDNVLITAGGDVFFVDWPSACTGAAWFDLVAMLPSITLEGGGPPEEVFARTPAARRTDADAVTTAVVAVAGYFVRNGQLPPPPGLPTLRAFQAAQGEITMAWLRERLAVRDHGSRRANLSG